MQGWGPWGERSGATAAVSGGWAVLLTPALKKSVARQRRVQSGLAD